jgi:hypothetical protein
VTTPDPIQRGLSAFAADRRDFAESGEGQHANNCGKVTVAVRCPKITRDGQAAQIA